MSILDQQQKEKIKENKAILEEQIVTLIKEWQEVNGVDITEFNTK